VSSEGREIQDTESWIPASAGMTQESMDDAGGRKKVGRITYDVSSHLSALCQFLRCMLGEGRMQDVRRSS